MQLSNILGSLRLCSMVTLLLICCFESPESCLVLGTTPSVQSKKGKRLIEKGWDEGKAREVPAFKEAFALRCCMSPYVALWASALLNLEPWVPLLPHSTADLVQSWIFSCPCFITWHNIFPGSSFSRRLLLSRGWNSGLSHGHFWWQRRLREGCPSILQGREEKAYFYVKAKSIPTCLGCKKKLYMSKE